MKKRIIGVCLVAGIIFLSGCGVTTARDLPGGNADVASGAGIREDGEGQTGRENVVQKRSCYENDISRYAIEVTETENKNFYELYQYRLDGAFVKRMDLEDEKEVSLEWVTDNWLYYTSDGALKDVLWRIPIQKTEGGEDLLFHKMERLLMKESIEVRYATEEYLILEVWGDYLRGKKVFKLDLKTMKLSNLEKEFQKIAEIDSYSYDIPDFYEVLWSGEYPLLADGGLVIDTLNGDALCRFDPDTEQLSWIPEEDEEILRAQADD